MQHKFSFHYLPTQILVSYFLATFLYVGLSCAVLISVPIYKLEEAALIGILTILMLGAVIGGLVGIIHIFRRIGRKYMEEIEFFEEGFQSKRYGEIWYKDIEFHAPANPTTTQPSLFIKLQNGKVFKFAFNTFYQKEAVEITAFTEHFEQTLSNYCSNNKIEENIEIKAKEVNQRGVTFSYLPIKYIYWISAMIFGGPIVLMPVFLVPTRIYFENFFTLVLWGVLLLIILAISYFVFKLIQNSNLEKITFSQDGLHSKLFGEVHYKNVSSYRISLGLSRINVAQPSPSLLIKLKDGKTIRFDLNAKHYEVDIHDYSAFVHYFVEEMGKRATLRNFNLKKDYEKAIEGLKKAEQRGKNRFNNYVKLVFIVFGLAVLNFIIRLIISFMIE